MSRLFMLLALAAVLALNACQRETAQPEAGVPVKDTLPAAEAQPAATHEPPAEAFADEPPAEAFADEPPASETPATDDGVPAEPPTASESIPATAEPQEPAPSKSPEPTADAAPVHYEGTAYGAEITTPAMPVIDFLTSEAIAEDQVVTLEGTLGQVCQDMGCWFFLEGTTPDGTKKKLYVDLQMGAIFTIPANSEGQHAVVLGRVAKNAKGWKLIGKGVVLS